MRSSPGSAEYRAQCFLGPGEKLVGHEFQDILAVHTVFKSYLGKKLKLFSSLDSRPKNFHNQEIIPGV